MSEATTSTKDVSVVTGGTPTKQRPPPPPLSGFSEPASAPRKIKSVTLIFNPVAGNKRARRRAEKIVQPMLEAAGIAVTMLPTEFAGHATELAATCQLEGRDADC